MTEIKIWQDEPDHHISIRGHSGFNIQGKDIVCAGISTLAFTLLNQLSTMEDRHEGVHLSYQITDGGMHIIFSGDEKKISLLESLVVTGFLMLEENFPENLRVTRGEKIFEIC